MPYVFALGVGRSGTTWLGRLLACTSTPARFVSELCPGLRDRIPSPLYMVEPEDSACVERVRDAIGTLGSGGNPFCPEQSRRLERDDRDAQVVIVKDVHSLLAYPEILAGLDDWRAVVIARDTLRSVDSYFHGHPSSDQRYLLEERAYLARQLASPVESPLLEATAASVHPRVVRYLRRSDLLASELLKHAAITEFVQHFLAVWAEHEARVTRVQFEDLCRDPDAEVLRLYDFLGLAHDDASLAGIQRMTTGTSREYYATDKDSQAILEQSYKYLRPRHRRRVASLLGRREAVGAR